MLQLLTISTNTNSNSSFYEMGSNRVISVSDASNCSLQIIWVLWLDQSD